MVSRCTCKNDKSYHNYGARGIKIADEWLDKENGFMNFLKWSKENGYKEEILANNYNKWSIDRINNNGNYEPSNCRWTTTDVQTENKRISRTTKFFYKGLTLGKYCKLNNYNYWSIRSLTKTHNRTVEQAVEIYKRKFQDNP